MHKTNLMFLLLATVLFSGDLFAQDYESEGWELTKENSRNGIRVYQREDEGYAIRSFLAIGAVEASIPKILTLMTDEEIALDMMHKIKNFKLMEEISSFEVIQYLRIEAPFPIKDRDIVLKARSQKRPGQVVISTRPINDYYPEQDGVVRMTDYYMDWTMTPQQDGSTMIEIQGRGDPGGYVPAWAVNLTLNSVPYMTLKKMQRGMKRHKNVDTRKYDIWDTKPVLTQRP